LRPGLSSAEFPCDRQAAAGGPHPTHRDAMFARMNHIRLRTVTQPRRKDVRYPSCCDACRGKGKPVIQSRRPVMDDNQPFLIVPALPMAMSRAGLWLAVSEIRDVLHIGEVHHKPIEMRKTNWRVRWRCLGEPVEPRIGVASTGVNGSASSLFAENQTMLRPLRAEDDMAAIDAAGARLLYRMRHMPRPQQRDRISAAR
jgi:hypothetical protein